MAALDVRASATAAEKEASKARLFLALPKRRFVLVVLRRRPGTDIRKLVGLVGTRPEARCSACSR